MSIVTIDFETPYGKGARSDHILHKYSLTSMTYEEYIRDPRFKVFGVAIKVDDGETEYYSNETNPGSVADALNAIFTPGNDHIAVAHNMLFDGAILSWYYGLAADQYWCTQAMSRALWNQRSSSLEQLCISCYPDDETIRKGAELVQFANIYAMDDEQDAIMAKYCINDVDVTFACLRQIWRWMPQDELDILDMTLKMFIHPAFVLDHERVQRFLDDYNQETDEIIEKSGVSRSTLTSPKKFAEWVKEHLDLDIPLIPSPTEKNPDNIKYALGKDELAFVNFQMDNPEHQHIWDARLRAASSIDRTRAERLLTHGAIGPYNPQGRVAVPLNYAKAHTLRWGGTNKINLQNLRRGSELRKSLKAPDGYQVVVADLSNIEGRLNAWFCQEQRMLDIFAMADGDLYCDFASQVYKREIKKKENPTERFVGKTCLAGDTKVLTNTGWKLITNITPNDKLWDGISWVEHDGLIHNGLQQTMTHAGISATPNHEILLQDGSWVEFGQALKNKALFQSALSSVTLPSLHTHPTPLKQVSSGVGDLFANASAAVSTKFFNIISELAEALTATHAPKNSADKNAGINTKPHSLTMPTAADCSTDSLQLSPDATIPTMLNITIMEKGASMSSKSGETIDSLFLNMFRRSTAGIFQSMKWIGSTTTKVTNRATSAFVQGLKTLRTKEMSQSSSDGSLSLKNVYDIANAGPRHRFTILTNQGPIIVHNCILGLGYQTGPPKLQTTLYLGSNKEVYMSLDQCKQIVYEEYRGTYTNIVKGWEDAQFAISKMYSMAPDETMQWRCLEVQKGRIKLPNGLYLNYPNLQVEMDEYDRPQFSYWNGDLQTKIYGGKLIENVIQALARCTLSKMMLEINGWLITNRSKYGNEAKVVLTVHDEIIVIAKTEYAEGVYNRMVEFMSVPPEWANDGSLVLQAEGGWADEYSK